MTLQTVIREKACQVCGHEFLPFRSMQTVCGTKCALKVGPITRRKATLARKMDRARLNEMRPLSYWRKQAQVEVNRYVRARDALLGCVSCSLPASWDGQWHASHLRSTGAAPGLRFHLWNIHKSCSPCNNWKSGNLSEYEPRLRARIGDAKVDWLRTQNGIVKDSREYLQRLAKVFRKRANRREKSNGSR